MASNIFSSEKSEKNWVVEVDKNFCQEEILDIDFDTPTSVFRVPKTLSETKPEAYSPQCVGLGPYHHARSVLYRMHKRKLSVVRKFLNQGNMQTFQQVVNALVEYEPILRACYDQYIDLDIQTLARILAIDGLYLLNLLENKDPDITEVIGDVLMLENQIPFILLEKIVQVLQFKTGAYENLFFAQFESICQAESPLNLNRQRMMAKISYSNQSHLMHQMYYLILNNRGLEPISNMSLYVPETVDDFDTSLPFLGQRVVVTAANEHQSFSSDKGFTWSKISGLFRKRDTKKESTAVEKIDIPSVSDMTDMVGIQFTLINGGIRDIEFVESAKKFYLPVISLKPTSEIILRNLVAFEAVTVKTGSTCEFAEYVDLMCGLIISKKDVDILREAGIIESELADEEIVSIFTGIKKSTGMNNIPQSNIEHAVDDVKKQYNNVFRVKVRRMAGSYGSALLMFLKTGFFVLVLVLATWQAYSLVSGCYHWFDKSNVVQAGGILVHLE